MRVLVLVLVLPSAFAQPVRTVWIRSATGAGPEVHGVEVSGDAVTVRSAGISLGWLGPLGTPPRPLGARAFAFRIPLRPVPARGVHSHVPADYAGVFVNGVPIFNQLEASSWQEQNLWHFDPLGPYGRRLHGAPRAGLLEALAGRAGGAAPIIGFALDGYPVYGPDGKRSSYRLRRISARDRWPDGTRLAPGQEGPAVNAEFPLGTFVEDYEYVAGEGELDEFNGAFVKTAEYPEGTYAYFLSVDAGGRPAFPYLFADRFYGEFSPRRIPGALQFRVPDGRGGLRRHLEFVHEKPMHVMVISHDRRRFAHIHPEVNEEGVWEVPFPFAEGGRYRVFWSYTPPGGAARTEHLDVSRAGGAGVEREESPGMVRMESSGPIRAGADVELRFRVEEGVRGWEPYLGAWAHVVIAGEGLGSMQHAHPDGGRRADGAHVHGLAAAPEVVRIPVHFGSAGPHTLWFQFQVQGRVHTVPFALTVLPGVARRSAEPVPKGALRIRTTAEGYEPARLAIPANRAITLAFQRTGEGSCGNRVVFPALGLEAAIAPGGTTVLTLPPQPAGEIRFGCGMGMMRGALVAVSGDR